MVVNIRYTDIFTSSFLSIDSFDLLCEWVLSFIDIIKILINAMIQHDIFKEFPNINRL